MDVRVALAERSYTVRLGALSGLRDLVPGLATRRIHPVVDTHVAGLHGAALSAALDGLDGASPIALPRGERAKAPDAYLSLCRGLLAAGIDRDGVVLAVGGGAACDVTGFAAASLYRGVDWIAVPTTLLAMVDASVGGKTAIDLDGAKNVVGAFHQPIAVLADLDVLATLDRRELTSGLVEAFKIGLVRDAAFAAEIGGRAGALRRADRDALLPLVRRAVELKAEIVAEDERERGTRALLNFGHTVGHALEAATGLVRWRHGEAVAIGLVAALRLSVRVAGLEAASAGWGRGVLEALGAPTADPTTPWAAVAARLPADKKARRGLPAFVLTPRIGSGTVGHRISQDIVNEEVAGLFGGDG